MTCPSPLPRLLACCAALIGLLRPALAPAQGDESAVVPSARLLQSPQVFWSRPILFKDTLAEPPGGQTLELDGVRYHRFTGSELGVCYAANEAFSVLQSARVGDAFSFHGTVLSRKRGLPFFRRTEFLVVATRAAAIRPGSLDSLADTIEALRGDEALRKDPSLNAVIALYEDLQAAALNYAQENDIPLKYVLEPGSEHLEKMNQLLRRQLRSMELQNATTAQTILTDFIRIALAHKHLTAAEPGQNSADPGAPEDTTAGLPAETSEEPNPPEPDTPAAEADIVKPSEVLPLATELREHPLPAPEAPTEEATVQQPSEATAPATERKPGFFERRRLRRIEKAEREARERAERAATAPRVETTPLPDDLNQPIRP